jgi:HTH-type transcriptional regulator/antitoxin HigA
MKTKTKTRLHFAGMPKDYEALCRLFLPRPIRDKADYANTVEVADIFAGFEEVMNADQEDYFDILCRLIEAWDAEHVTWPGVSGLDVLRLLVEEHGLSGADLSRILGVSRLLGPMILRGEREITAAHARALGAHFGLPAGTFIE